MIRNEDSNNEKKKNPDSRASHEKLPDTLPGEASLRMEESNKRVRAYVGGEVVVDSLHPLLVWEHEWYPAYYFPREDVHATLHEIAPDHHTESSPPASSRSPSPVFSPLLGNARHFTVLTKGKKAKATAWCYPQSRIERIGSLLRFEWDTMDAWFEEDEEVLVHPRDPYKRIDILHSSRLIEIGIEGTPLAVSRQPRLLFETGLPPRYYLPKVDVRMELLLPSRTATQCPYKGSALHWSIQTDEVLLEDAAWSYPAPLPESSKIVGLIAFYNEYVDIRVDGKLQTRPKTPFSEEHKAP